MRIRSTIISLEMNILHFNKLIMTPRGNNLKSSFPHDSDGLKFFAKIHKKTDLYAVLLKKN